MGMFDSLLPICSQCNLGQLVYLLRYLVSVFYCIVCPRDMRCE